MIPAQEPETDLLGLSLRHEATPIFVDETGRRSWLVRWAAYGIGAVCLSYTALVGVSIAGDPALPRALMPFPDSVSLPDREGAPAEDPVHTGLGPEVPGPLVLPFAPPATTGRPGAQRTSTVVVAVRPTPSPTQRTPVSLPPVTSEPTQLPEATRTRPPATKPPTSEPTRPPEATPTPPATQPPTTQPPTTQPPTNPPAAGVRNDAGSPSDAPGTPAPTSVAVTPSPTPTASAA